MHNWRKTTFAVLALGALTFPACSQAGIQSTASKSEIEAIVHDYILENPEIIEEALIELDKRRNWETINDNKAQIYNNPLDVSVGPKNAKVTIIEFFDYNCSYCKLSTDWLMKTINAQPEDVRVIFKELPILDKQGGTSRNAALAALAADRQGKYLEMHQALMEMRSLSPERVDMAAEKVGLDIDQMHIDMKDPKLDAHLQETILLARDIRPLSGTPFFIINDEYLAGADETRLQSMLDDAMKG